LHSPRIEAQLPGDSTLAKTGLSWITYTQGLLTAEEICDALTVKQGDEESGFDNILGIQDLISLCASLITVDVESNIVRLIQYATQEYYERIRDSWNPAAQQQIASTGLIYLSFREFEDSRSSNTDSWRREEQFSFLNYTVCHWGNHGKDEEEQIFEL
jgi:hypothetical protein